MGLLLKGCGVDVGNDEKALGVHSGDGYTTLQNAFNATASYTYE